MRITVDFVLKLLGDGMETDEIVAAYPELEKEDVYQARQVRVARERENFCYSMRLLAESVNARA